MNDTESVGLTPQFCLSGTYLDIFLRICCLLSTSITY